MSGVTRWVDTQIWELGNSLDDIGQSLPHSDDPRKEPGRVFQNCVKEKLGGAQ